MDKGCTGEQEISLNSAQGKQLLMVRTSTLSLEDHITSGWVVVFDDVTSLVTAERDAAWGEVARRLAHEIKNPLTPIGLSAERIRRKYLHKLPEDEREALDRSTRTIAEQVQTLKRMVDAFASYARSERLNLRSADLNRLIEDVVELHREPGNPITFSLQLETELKPMVFDQDGIRQVLNNIVGNACEALKDVPGASISICSQRETQQDQSGVSVIIQDNGHGFEPEIIDRVFEPYITSKPDGTGLGMAIVKRITQAHGGFVIASNLDQGGGYVKIWLPESTSDTPDQTPPGRRPAENEPAFIIDVARRLAELRGVSVAEIATLTADNARRVFGIHEPFALRDCEDRDHDATSE